TQGRYETVQQAVDAVHPDDVADRLARHDLLAEAVEAGTVAAAAAGGGDDLVAVIQGQHMITHLREDAVHAAAVGRMAARAHDHEDERVPDSGAGFVYGQVGAVDGL